MQSLPVFICSDIILLIPTPLFVVLSVLDEYNQVNAVCKPYEYCYSIQTIGGITLAMLICIFGEKSRTTFLFFFPFGVLQWQKGMSALSSAISCRKKKLLDYLLSGAGVFFVLSFGVALFVYGVILRGITASQLDYNSQLENLHTLESNMCFACGASILLMVSFFILYEVYLHKKNITASNPPNVQNDNP